MGNSLFGEQTIEIWILCVSGSLAMLKPDSRVLWRLGVHLPSTEEQMVQVTLEHYREILTHNIHLRNGPEVDWTQYQFYISVQI